MAKKVIIANHKLFVKEYQMNGNNAAKAYMKVYKTKSKEDAAKHGYKLLRTPNVKELIAQHRKELDEQYQINRGTVTKELLDLVERCKDDDDRANLLKSLEVMNKMAGNYTHKQEIDVSAKGIIFNFIEPDKPEEDKSEEE